MGAVEVRLPRVSDVPKGVSPDGFQSEIVARYQPRSRTQARLMVRLYLEGLANGDFEPVFRALVGDTACVVADQHRAAERRMAAGVRDLEETAAAWTVRLSVRRRLVSKGWWRTRQDGGVGRVGRG
jgi:hypothetical protein